jgi:steroid delta-isomerase-like uncharacterized protein
MDPTVKEVAVTQSAADVVRATVELFNTDDFDGMRELYADDVWEQDPNHPERNEGVDAVIADARHWRTAFPDSHFTVQGVIADGDDVALEVEVTGTHTGPLVFGEDEWPASNRPFKVNFAIFSSVAAGKVRAIHMYFDRTGLNRQLGLDK